MTDIGLGCKQFDFGVYIGNRPNMLEYQSLTGLTSLSQGEIYAIGQACGNGWRKVFNVYAKVLFALDPKVFEYANLAPSWQNYRDQYLLQSGSQTALLFTPPDLQRDNSIHIICGRTHAQELINSQQLDLQLSWLNQEFAIDEGNKLIVCPYFDYRQLSNIKIEQLAALILKLLPI